MGALGKDYALSAHQIRPVATGHGACFATDEITVKARRIGYAYREAPDDSADSGWRFTAGDESDAYMDDPANHGVYDVNTIANYDPGIIPILNSEIGVAFVRDERTGEFVKLPLDEGHE